MTPREEHLDLLKRALELTTLGDVARDMVEDMLERMTTEAEGSRRCAHAAPRWQLHALTERQERFVRKLHGEELPPPETRLTDGRVPRGREVAMAPVLSNRPLRPPGRIDPMCPTGECVGTCSPEAHGA